MTLEELEPQVDSAVAQHQKCKEAIEKLTLLIEREEMQLAQAEAAAASVDKDDSGAYRAALVRAREIAASIQSHQQELQRAREEMERCRQYLSGTHGKLAELCTVFQGKIDGFSSAISSLGAASSRMFGGSAASEKVASLSRSKAVYEHQLNMARSLMARIESVLGDSGGQYVKTLRR